MKRNIKSILSILLISFLMLLMSVPIASASTASQLPAPTNFKATAYSDTIVELSWNAVSGASGYNLYRMASNESTWTKIYNLPSMITSISDYGCSPSTKYNYLIVAVDSSGLEGNSMATSVTTYPTPLPAPTGFTATTFSSTIIELNWNAVSGAQGYHIYRKASYESDWTEIYDYIPASWTSADDYGCSPNTTYTYYIVAVDSSGQEGASMSASATTMFSDVPFQPENLVAVPTSPSSVQLSWDPSLGATSYNVYCGISGQGSQSLVGNPDSNSFNVKNLNSGTTYVFIVTAKNSFGESNGSNIVTATTPQS